MLNLTIKQMEIFECAAEHESFSEAAAELYIGQSTVSGAIAELEQTLGAKLFDRSAKKKMRITDAGKEVYDTVHRILEQCRQLEGTEEDRPLKIGCSSIPSIAIAPKLMAGFSSLHPECCFEMFDGDSADVHELIKAGKIDLGFVGSALDRPSLIYDRVAVDEMVLITPDTEKYRAAKAANAMGIELLSDPIIFREQGSGTQRQIDRYLTENGINTENIHVAARMTSPRAIENAVSAGLGVSIVSRLSLKPGNYLVFPLDRIGLRREFYLVRRKKDKLTRLGDAFVQYVLSSREN